MLEAKKKLIDSVTMEESFVDQVESLIDRTFRVVAPLWQRRRQLGMINGIIFVLLLLYLLFLTTPYYESSATVLPDYGNKSLLSGLGGLGELASASGLNIGQVNPSEIYQNLVTSEPVLAPVIYSKYHSREFKDSVNLIEYFHVAGVSGDSGVLLEREKFIRLCAVFPKRNLQTNVDDNYVLTIKVTMPESQLSADVANRVVESLDNYIRTKRKSYASNQRFYLDKRIVELHDSLSAAEARLADFITKNRVSTQSPLLSLQRSRLEREVDLLQAVYVQLSQQLELAKVDEIRDTPVLNIREKVSDPIFKAGPSRKKILVLVMLLTFVLTSAYFMFEPELGKLWQKIRSSTKSASLGKRSA